MQSVSELRLMLYHVVCVDHVLPLEASYIAVTISSNPRGNVATLLADSSV
jgi:hypothetical protein